MQSLLSFISSREQGVTTRELQKEFEDTPLQEIASGLNALAKQGLVDIFKTQTDIIYKRNTEQHRFSGPEEKIVYLLIKEAGSEGIWIRDIKTRSGLHQNLLTKILKGLEQRVLVKPVKSVKSNRKVYMLYEEVPSDAHTDGPWFTSDAELDTGFVEAIKSVITEWLPAVTDQNELPLIDELPRTKDIHAFLVRSGVSSVPIGLTDIDRILQILVHEKKAIGLNPGQGISSELSSEMNSGIRYMRNACLYPVTTLPK